MQTKRIEALDAFRGIAILGMILSGSIAYGDVLPAWMYHAQVPPPAHTFNPDIPGITWVDLVFPFFLFTMGAAFPFSLRNKIDQLSYKELLFQILKRGGLLLFFGLFIKHIEVYTLHGMNVGKACTALFAFILLHILFVQWPYPFSRALVISSKVVAFVSGCVLISTLNYPSNDGFNINRMDIIIIVLANMAVFGAIAWLITRKNVVHRLLILPVIMGFFLSGAIENSWQHSVYTFTPIRGLYSFYYLKYLFIIVPGSLAGDYIIEFKNRVKSVLPNTVSSQLSWMMILFTLILVIGNLYGLFTRNLLSNLLFSVSIGGLLLLLSHKLQNGSDSIYHTLNKSGAYLLFLGLVFEAYQGGIKKDSSTYSYYFVTSGLAFFVLSALLLLEQLNKMKIIMRFLALNGKNPMVAYVAGALIITPLYYLLGLNAFINSLNANSLTGFLKGVLYTGLASTVTILLVKAKHFWKT